MIKSSVAVTNLLEWFSAERRARRANRPLPMARPVVCRLWHTSSRVARSCATARRSPMDASSCAARSRCARAAASAAGRIAARFAHVSASAAGIRAGMIARSAVKLRERLLDARQHALDTSRHLGRGRWRPRRQRSRPCVHATIHTSHATATSPTAGANGLRLTSGPGAHRPCRAGAALTTPRTPGGVWAIGVWAIVFFSVASAAICCRPI